MLTGEVPQILGNPDRDPAEEWAFDLSDSQIGNIIAESEAEVKG
jgi:hypothetical protein